MGTVLRHLFTNFLRSILFYRKPKFATKPFLLIMWRVNIMLSNIILVQAFMITLFLNFGNFFRLSQNRNSASVRIYPSNADRLRRFV